MKYLFTISICCATLVCFAQQKQKQFILIIRSKSTVNATPEKIKSNIGHWTEWMTDLGKNGKIAGGYRPANDGVTISGADKTAAPTAYLANGEEVSSFLIINATDMEEAKQIAAKCPVFELQGNVEIRPIRDVAN